MSLKAKLEAVIYAAEEPVTLNQLAALFAADALEWKAAQEAAAAEQTAEVAGISPDFAQTLPLIEQGPPVSIALNGGTDDRTPEAVQAESVEAIEPSAAPDSQRSQTEASPANEVVSISEAEAYPSIVVDGETLPSPPEPSSATPSIDPETEAKRLARQRDREVKAVLKQLLDELMATSQADGRGVEIREIAGGYRMATKPECHDAVRLFVKSLKPPLKLSMPALETLAVIAYKQPVTAPEVSEIRGVETAGVLGSLLARKLIATAGRKQVIGRPILYKTTKEFLLRFGLKDVSELPSMEEFEKMAATELEIEPEAAEADRAAQRAEAADNELAAEGDAGAEQNIPPELESNSPSGEELAGASETVEDGAHGELEESAGAEIENGETEPEASTDSSSGSDAGEEASVHSQSAPEEIAPDQPGPQQEIEANAHAQESQEER
jgi:segregation and condensation protein B